MCLSIRLQGAGQDVLDLRSGRPLVHFAELHTDSGRAVSLRAHGRYPDHLAGNGQPILIFHQGQEHEYLVAQFVTLVGWDEQPTILDIGHVRGIKRALVTDRQGEDALALAVSVSRGHVVLLARSVGGRGPNPCHRKFFVEV
jgi:hypothetical protein